MGAKVKATTVPGAPIVSSALVQLRGTSGSGKTTAMKYVMEKCNATPIRTNDGMTKNLVYRGVNGSFDGNIYFLGDYSPHRSAGGCDTIPSVQEVIDLIEEYGSRKNSLVVFEGLLLAHSWGALGEYAHERWGERYVNVFLDTPEDVCLKRVIERRAKRGEETVGDRLTKISKNVHDDHYRVALCFERVVARGGVRKEISHQDSQKQFWNIVKRTALKYCED